MKFKIVTLLSVLCVFCVLQKLHGARVLVVLPIPAYSHHIPFRPLWTELLKRGHEIVLITTNPIPNVNLTNLKQIDVGSSYQDYKKISYAKLRLNQISWISFLKKYIKQVSELFTHHTLNHPEVKKLYAPDSNEKFDVIFIEMFCTPSIFFLVHRFNAPFIGLSPFGLAKFESFMLGGLILPSHESTWEMESNIGTNLSFWKRLQNFWTMWHYIYVLGRITCTTHQEIAEVYFGSPLPSLMDIVKNISIVFVNEDPVMTYAHPDLPNIIRFHSIHVAEDPEPLPQDLQNFVDNATDGFIYLSFGTNVQFLDFPDEIQQVFYDTLIKLPYKVVWKIEKKIPRKLDNAYIASWFPQKTILAHPNIKLFVYQGGMQSSQEAIHNMVPMLGIPILADQDFQVNKLKFLGVGDRLDIKSVTRELLNSSIRELINNKKYKENIIKLQKLIKDKPYNTKENLVWWTEYVIRNKGAPHLRSTTTLEPWYQYNDMDIVAFLAIVTFILATVVLAISVKCLMFMCKQCRETPVNREKKMS